MNRLFKTVFFVVAVLSATTTWAGIESYDITDEETLKRYQTFTEEMRCPKCQNQNLADSNSPIAADLRGELRRLLMEEKSDDEIINFMVSRYGEFVLYNPRLQGSTVILWVGPVVLLLIGLCVLLWMLRLRSGREEVLESEQELSTDEHQRLNNLLQKSSSENDDSGDQQHG